MNPKITLNPMNKSKFFVDACYFGKKNKIDDNIINMGKLTHIELGSLQQLNDDKPYVFGNKMCANFEKHPQKICNDDKNFMLSSPMICPSLYQRGKEMINKLSCTGTNCISPVANGGKYRSRLHRKTKRSRKTRRHRKTKKSRKYRK